MRIFKIFTLLLLSTTLWNCGNDNNTTDGTETMHSASTKESSATAKPATHTITGTTIIGIRPGSTIADLSAKITEATSDYKYTAGQTIYKYADAKGMELGYFLPDTHDANKVGEIHVTNPEVATTEGVRVGMTYGELEQQIGNYKKYGADTGKRIDFVYGTYVFRIDQPSEQVGEGSVKDARITRVIIPSPGDSIEGGM